jgi:hypothetical protein
VFLYDSVRARTRHRNDRNFCLDRNLERAFFEVVQPSIGAARSLGVDEK